MTQEREVLRMALEALERKARCYAVRDELQISMRDAIVAIKEALAQPQPEPCDMGQMCIGCSPRNADGSCPDAQRKPLTDEQIDEIYFKSSLVVVNRCDDMYDFVRAIEAAHNIKE